MKFTPWVEGGHSTRRAEKSRSSDSRSGAIYSSLGAASLTSQSSAATSLNQPKGHLSLSGKKRHSAKLCVLKDRPAFSHRTQDFAPNAFLIISRPGVLRLELKPLAMRMVLVSSIVRSSSWRDDRACDISGLSEASERLWSSAPYFCLTS